MNKIFIAIAAILGVLILFGILFIFYVVSQNEVIVDDFGDPTPLAATNTYVGTAIAATATAKAWTPTPTPQ